MAAEDKYSSEFSGSDDDEEPSWIQWFCSLRGNEFFCAVDEDYIQDDFNLTGLSSIVPYYEFALDTILDCDTPNAVLNEEHQEMIETAAEMLYGLIHARFILTNRGLAAMAEKYSALEFGRCPRVHCEGQGVLPVGESDLPRNSTVRVYCPRCEQIYVPRSTRQANIDGAYFGTTFAHLVFQIYPELMPSPPTAGYVPRIYGFKIHPAAKDRILAAKKAAKKKAKAADGAASPAL
eukprot:Amastigsp_a165_739.p1 type:complete len:235 gc:universal Amastigsp_a165_739:40-744(+)